LSRSQRSIALKKPQLWMRLLTLIQKQEIIVNTK
jgi:hypothetical protein